MSVPTAGDITDAVEVEIGRPLTSSERARVGQWITDVEALISAKLGDLTLLDASLLGYVVRSAVVSMLRNPDGVQSETIDDYTYRYGTETRRITILPEWWDLLAPNRGSGAFSSRPSFEPDTSLTTINDTTGWS